jgi:hypothetical protein
MYKSIRDKMQRDFRCIFIPNAFIPDIPLPKYRLDVFKGHKQRHLS